MAKQRRIVVIGGSAAGPKAAAKARRMDQHADVTIIQKDAELSMASCGYPYYVGGVFHDRNELLATPAGVVRDPKFYLNAKGIQAITNTEAMAIDRAAHTVTCTNLLSGEVQVVPYDKLVVATGANAVMPPIPGVALEGVTAMQRMRDADYLRKLADEKKAKRALVVGGGLIGIETYEALHLAGMEITGVEMLPQLLAFLDWDMAKLVENHVRSKGVRVILNDAVTEFIGRDGHVVGARLRSGGEVECDVAVVAIGVRPNVTLARDAGLAIGDRGGIAVNEYMQTSDPDIYAVGDCIEVPHLITGDRVLAPYGDLANLEGRVAGQNAVAGNTVTFPGTIMTGVCKVFDFVAGATGLSGEKSKKAGFTKAMSVVVPGPDKPHFMGGKPLVLKLVGDPDSGRILGLQCVGTGDVSKRIAAAAMAILGKLTLADVANADLPYAPPFSPALDNLITAAHCLENKMLGRFKGISCVEVKAKLDAGDDMLLLDCRSPEEYDEVRLGVGECLMPLGALRKRLNELPEDKGTEIICYCMISLRGYEAAGVLEANGYTNVKVMEGGISAWPFPREK
ncbi:MAG TPA: FAD-dependent oxidoreductase [Candidatus Hydrogenedentes bacterium]|nr:FAD-dependent oxidoreductase [Candidatus Hydrogenedentota bacterium]HPG65491.1 FAD-dependent oxidoreductase [Candidatus Hydrogenedentota bacterium]